MARARQGRPVGCVRAGLVFGRRRAVRARVRVGARAAQRAVRNTVCSARCASKVRLHFRIALHGNLSPYFWRMVHSAAYSLQCTLSAPVACCPSATRCPLSRRTIVQFGHSISRRPNIKLEHEARGNSQQPARPAATQPPPKAALPAATPLRPKIGTLASKINSLSRATSGPSGSTCNAARAKARPSSSSSSPLGCQFTPAANNASRRPNSARPPAFQLEFGAKLGRKLRSASLAEHVMDGCLRSAR